jgi:STE24 endopeptidase
LTGDREVYRATHLDLARANLSDLDPPRLLYVLVFTHPSPPERLAAAGV